MTLFAAGLGTPAGLALLPSVLDGDYNNNGVVDAADYTVWRDTLGRSGFGLAADGDLNGAIELADYLVWKSNFGMTAGAGSGSAGASPSRAAVPEPANILLLALAAPLVAWRSRFRLARRAC